MRRSRSSCRARRSRPSRRPEMPARLEVTGERQTIAALEHAAAAADDDATLRAAAELILPTARALGPNDTGMLAGSYSVTGDPPGVGSPLVHAGIIEYGWPARGRPAYRRVHAA